MPASPLLLLVPYRYKAAVLYSQIPISASASGDFVVSRAGNTASRILGNGNIEAGVLANIARINYPRTGVASGCAGLLVEPSAQNLAWHSHLWETANNWANTEITVVTGTSGTTDPFGTNLANAISPTSGSSAHIAQSNSPTNISYTNGTIYTQSAFFKQGTGNAGRYVQMTFPGVGNAFTQLGYANFDLQLGAVTVVTGVSGDVNRAARIENYGNGWYRCQLTATANVTAGGAGVAAILITSSGSTRAFSFSGTTTDILYGFGAQLEVGSVATSYIPTTTAAVTRNADVITNNQFVIPNLIGAILTEFESLTSGTYFVDNLPVTLVSGYNKVAISYTPTTITVYRNGTQVSGSPFSPPGGVLPILGNVINIGHNNQYYQLGANIRSFVLYSSTLTAAEASGLTT
jgi:hypothetical protein